MLMYFWANQEAHIHFLEICRNCFNAPQVVKTKGKDGVAIISNTEFALMEDKTLRELPDVETVNASTAKQDFHKLLKKVHERKAIINVVTYKAAYAGKNMEVKQVVYMVPYPDYRDFVTNYRAMALRRRGLIEWGMYMIPTKGDDGNGYCPVCDEPLFVNVCGRAVNLGWHHCPNCGQRIDNMPRKAA